jgi:ubiquinone biosynthesis protein
MANMTRDLLERMSQPHAADPPPPWRERSDGWVLRLLGASLLAGGAIMASTLVADGTTLVALVAWPAWIMLVAGLYLVVRR